ncbi:bifunctional glutamine synthetase adenylyltransferase/deadenyltransferase [Legionella quinlivanii]|uniref:Bifunctional glutamine synthetase adenylyltransferase/deadenyltransferase n=1 Tax=Legionella quinlivanii TaxID=45073 RepID=A0A364LF81_9GAMM|nr:bifunctional [glutamate--ammonia ligase]-adenylyl-L-tyrosine phosphorylase/[glutamate--ammonia-ligase] adenylyltransferase [Legionella quinlivanii]RAP34459.1 bifunctional glutamine synthetase adenylyltransferase/deadenyltransferase [Legionella quinlivanii]
MTDIEVFIDSRSQLLDKHFSHAAPHLRKGVQKVLLSSDYALRHIEIFSRLVTEDDCLAPVFAKEYRERFQTIPNSPFPSFAKEIRQYRHYSFLRLLLREASGLADTAETMRSWSDFADEAIRSALSYCEQDVSQRHGIPLEESGDPARLYVLAMGKLGGRELNYSSDIDLILAYSKDGWTDGEESISNQQFYIKVVQRFIQLLQQITAEGFVFRVDLRLRPNGDSGALVINLATVENYYQEQGRDWERYAMVKARPLDLTVSPDHWFYQLITPFVYRRYVDFSVIESLRSMKSMIIREVQLNPRLNDIKRGSGGIREIEFIVQNIQLIRGGRLPQLQKTSLLEALATIKQEKLLTRAQVLQEAYLFYRKLENALQSLNDQQTHVLPEDELRQFQISQAMNYTDWQSVYFKLKQYQRIVSNLFSSMLAYKKSSGQLEDNSRLLEHQLASVWQGHIESEMATNLLASINYQHAKRCYQLIHSFRHSPRCLRLSQAARMILDRFMPLLLKELAQVKNTEAVLLQVMQLLENVVGRSAYLALLTENPQTLNELLYWFSRSPFISQLLVAHPFLLETLLEPMPNWTPPSRLQLKQQLEKKMAHCKDQEDEEEYLRQFKLSHWLLAARAELHGQLNAIRAGRFLADLAEAIVVRVVEIASRQLALRYPVMDAVFQGFAVLAYGKLGSREMNYNSDLDLVFIYTSDAEHSSLITRLTQKILHMLTTRFQSGILYQVDTRLRPSGSSGLLVSSLSSFVTYQQTEAWTWEHQALIRSRVLLGGPRVRAAFSKLKASIYAEQSNVRDVLDEVLSMREKMLKFQLGHSIKERPGGLVDLEFLVQCLILIHARKNYSRYTHTLSLLRQLAKDDILSKEQFNCLKEAYQKYHQVLHLGLLEDYEPSCEKELQQVFAISEAIYKQIKTS